jgi:hypothetical protein
MEVTEEASSTSQGRYYSCVIFSSTRTGYSGICSLISLPHVLKIKFRSVMEVCSEKIHLGIVLSKGE